MKDNVQKTILALAPMAGITDLPFRLICKEHGADIVYSEMISTAGLFYTKFQTLQLLESDFTEKPLVVQLFGNNPDQFARAAELISSFSEELNIIQDKKSKATINIIRPDGIDINFGCPVKKVIKQGSGCALMKNLALSRKIIERTLQNTDLPVSIKIRAGIENFQAMDFLENIADLGWKMVMVHARTYQQGFSGAIDTTLITKIKQHFPAKSVLANGGIMRPEDAKEILSKTKADGIGLARGVLGAPWLFSQIKNYLESGNYQAPSLQEIINTALQHIDYAKKIKGEQALFEMRKHLGWYVKGLANAKAIRQQIYAAPDFVSLRKLLHEIKNTVIA